MELQQRHKKAITSLKKGEGEVFDIDYVIDEGRTPIPEQEQDETESVTNHRTPNIEGNKNVSIEAQAPLQSQSDDKFSASQPQQNAQGFILSNDILGLHFQQQQQQFNQQQLVISQQQNQIQQLENLIRINAVNQGILESTDEVKLRRKSGSQLQPEITDDVTLVRSELDVMKARASRDDATIASLHKEIKELLIRNAQLSAEIDLINQAPKSPRAEQFQVVSE